jgi:hypothetical protein
MMPLGAASAPLYTVAVTTFVEIVPPEARSLVKSKVTLSVELIGFGGNS